MPLLNYPRITGATPGKPFMFLIPASGDEPLTFAAKNLPAGLTLDAKTGLITGALKSAGRTVGRDHRDQPERQGAPARSRSSAATTRSR